jgi:hypothetical protein
MASMNYCFTVCRAADEKVQQETHPNAAPPSSSSSSANNSNSISPPTPGAYFFGRFFSFGSTPSASTSQLSNPFTLKASSFTDIDEDLF